MRTQITTRDYQALADMANEMHNHEIGTYEIECFKSETGFDLDLLFQLEIRGYVERGDYWHPDEWVETYRNISFLSVEIWDEDGCKAEDVDFDYKQFEKYANN